MRFFTMEWWCGAQEGDAGNPSPAYWAHLDTIRSRISPERLPVLEALLTLALHDSNVCRLQVEPMTATLLIELQNRYAGAGRVTLAYGMVERFASDIGRDGFAGRGYGDLGYDEVDLSPSGAFVHRMLFASGIEMAVEFHQFELLRGDAAEPGSAADGRLLSDS